MASGFDFEFDCGVPHQRCGDGHHGQSFLCRHGLHQSRSGHRDQSLWRAHDLAGSLCGRGHGFALGGDAHLDAGRHLERLEQFVVCVVKWARP